MSEYPLLGSTSVTCEDVTLVVTCETMEVIGLGSSLTSQSVD